jgi:hypothetical protein
MPPAALTNGLTRMRANGDSFRIEISTVKKVELGLGIRRSSVRRTERRYFSCDEIEVNFVFSLVPMPFTTAMIATEMPAAIRPYSMAVAPDSSLRKALSLPNMPAF